MFHDSLLIVIVVLLIIVAGRFDVRTGTES